jgi:hypothetical protein
MPLDVSGRTRATLADSMSLTPWLRSLGNLTKICRAGDRFLQLLILNEEFLVSVSHQLALITSLPFVHTARRSYRLDDPVKFSEERSTCFLLSGGKCVFPKSIKPYHLEEGEVVTRFP